MKLTRPDIITHLFDTHPLASEHDAEVDLSPVVTDAATAGDGGLQSWHGYSRSPRPSYRLGDRV